MYFSWQDGPNDEGAVCPACDCDTLIYERYVKRYVCENEECDHEEDEECAAVG